MSRTMLSAHRALIADEPPLPYFPYWLAIWTITLVGLSLVLPIVVDGSFPGVALLLCGAVSAACLYLIRAQQPGDQGFMRTGFHGGIVAFFLLMPMLFPDAIAERISSHTRDEIDLALLLSVLGFEASYWMTSVMRAGRPRKALTIDSARLVSGFLVRLIIFCVAAWAAYQVAFAMTIRARVIDVLLAMRNPIEGADDLDSVWRYGLRIAMAMLFLAAAAGCVIAVDRRGSIWMRSLGWGVIGGVAAIGFLTGSRGYFLFAAVPAAVTCWFTVMRLPKLPGLRLGALGAAAATVIGIWFTMSVVRDVERVDDVDLNPQRTKYLVESAFDIYSQMAVVIESFPRPIEYQYGASAIPVFLGWVPRAIWPQKPYPFSLLMNHIQGEELDNRTASLAPGLPAEGYGNFGMAGVLLWVSIMAVFCRLGDDYLQRVGLRNPLGLQLACAWCIWVALIVRGGVAEMLYMGLEVTIAPLALAILMSKRAPAWRVAHGIQLPIRRRIA